MDDLGAVLRAARRAADLSQRQLAARAGVSKSLVARLEASEPGLVDLDRLATVLAALGLRLAVLDEADRPAPAEPPGQPRDRAGRRFPPHLDLRKVDRFGDNWWGWLRYSTWADPPRPEYTFDLSRERRDHRRIRATASWWLAQTRDGGQGREKQGPDEDTGA